MEETLEDRLAAVERALTGDDHDLSALAAEGDTAERVQTLEAELDELRDRVDDLDAATQALRGYVGNVRAVNNEVRERANRALDIAEQGSDRPPETDTTTGSEGPRRTPDNPESHQTETPSATATGEPTLELAADETSDPPRTGGSRTDGCPLCDGGRGRAGNRTPIADETPHSECRTERTSHGRTDGGVVDAEETPESGNATVLTRIRALL